MSSNNPKLYSYTITHDWGAAPNPYWGLCTLAICKKNIRKYAKSSDWVVGFGSSIFPPKDIRNKKKRKDLSKEVIYAMKIKTKISLKKYNDWCTGRIDKDYFKKYKNNLAKKIPDYNNTEYKCRVGDCIYYDFHTDFPKILEANYRIGIHGPFDLVNDLDGINVLISDEFYYFGKQHVTIKEELEGIIHKRNYKSDANNSYVNEFIKWIESVEFANFKNPINPQPLLEDFSDYLPERRININHLSINNKKTKHFRSH